VIEHIQAPLAQVASMLILLQATASSHIFGIDLAMSGFSIFRPGIPCPCYSSTNILGTQAGARSFQGPFYNFQAVAQLRAYPANTILDT